MRIAPIQTKPVDNPLRDMCNRRTSWGTMERAIVPQLLRYSFIYKIAKINVLRVRDMLSSQE